LKNNTKIVVLLSIDKGGIYWRNMKGYLSVAYIVEVARTTKRILIAWDVEMKRNWFMIVLPVHAVLIKGYFIVGNVLISHVMC
jgi:hypothetical protein